MPSKIKKPCKGKFNTCSNKIPVGTSYCAECAPKEKERKRKADREYNRLHRDPQVTKWLRSARYNRARKFFLQANPLCAECEKEGRLMSANILHHIEQHNGDYALFWDQSNWQGLCSTCHEQKHVQDRWGRKKEN